jgi:START domain-containing protein
MKAIYSLTCFLLFFSTNTFTQNSNWELKKDKNDIIIYTRSVEGSGYKEFRGEMTVESKLSEVIKIFKNVDRFDEWMADVKKVEFLKSDEDNLYYYIETEVPWPIDNRDMVYHLHFTKENDTDVKVRVTGITDYVPEKKGIVRIEKVIGFWKLTVLGENSIGISYQLHAEPGGTIPKWLANAKIVDMPFATLRGLKDLLSKE